MINAFSNLSSVLKYFFLTMAYKDLVAARFTAVSVDRDSLAFLLSSSMPSSFQMQGLCTHCLSAQ